MRIFIAKKNDTYLGIVLTGPQMRKKPVTPLTVSYASQGVQQTTKAPTYKPVDNS